MTDWKRLEKDFMEIQDPFKDMRADWSDQPGIRNHWRLAAGLDDFARSRFESLARLAGKSLLSSAYAINKCSTDLRAIQDDMVRWLTGVRELTGKFEVGPIGTLLDSNEARVGTLCTGSINRVIAASALLCLQLAAEQTETSSIGANINSNANKQNRSFFMNPWVVGIGVTVIGGILLLIIANVFKEKSIEKKTPKQKIEEINVTQEGENLQNVTGAEISNNPNDLELGKVNIKQEGKNLQNVTGVKMKFDQNSGEVELKEKAQVIQKGPHGQSSVTLNADQPGVQIIFNKKSKED